MSVAGPRHIPFGTKVLIDGKEYIVHDRTAQWVEDKYGDTYDIYFENHEDAVEFGLRTTTVLEVVDLKRGE